MEMEHFTVLDSENGAHKSSRLRILSVRGIWRQFKRLKQKKGWKSTVTVGAICTSAILLANIIIMICANVAKISNQRGTLTLLAGGCTTVSWISVVAHFFINISSTILLGASNNAMQGLTAPTRKQVDAAHRRGSWLDIGTPSLRNIRSIEARRVILWLLLGLSSIPLHLMYNSVVSKTLGSNAYRVLTTTPSFTTNETWSWNRYECSSDMFYFDKSSGSSSLEFLTDVQHEASSWKRLENKDCINTYRQQALSDYATLIVVNEPDTQTDNTGDFFGVRSYDGGVDSMPDWICNCENCDCDARHLGASNLSAASWTQPVVVLSEPGNCTASDRVVQVNYCLAQPTQGTCRIVFNNYIMLGVIAMNIFKLTGLWLTLRLDINPLLTLGDALQSFLNDPDPYTAGSCSLSLLDTKTIKYPRTVLKDLYDYVAPKDQPRYWRLLCPVWAHSVRSDRWIIFNIAFVVPWVAGIVLLKTGLISLGVPFSDLGSYGLGKFKAEATIRMQPTFSSNVFLANTPQLIVSLLYVLYNSLFTCMLVGKEWNSYATERKPLRVTTPHGKQISTRFLQLPYPFSVPLLVSSAVLHWLLSQSIFAVAFRTTDYTASLRPPVPTDYALFGCGWSALGIILSIALSGLMVFMLWTLAFSQEYSPHMPVAGSCSLVISAACHPWPGDAVDTTGLLQYGVVEGTDGEVGHTCFTNGSVTLMQEGVLYE